MDELPGWLGLWSELAGPGAERRKKEVELQDLILQEQKQQFARNKVLFDQDQQQRQAVSDFAGIPTAQVASPETIGRVGAQASVPWEETLQAQGQARQPVRREGTDFSRVLSGLSQMGPGGAAAAFGPQMKELSSQAEQDRALQSQRETNRLNFSDQALVRNEENQRRNDAGLAVTEVLKRIGSGEKFENIDSNVVSLALQSGLGSQLLERGSPMPSPTRLANIEAGESSQLQQRLQTVNERLVNAGGKPIPQQDMIDLNWAIIHNPEKAHVLLQKWEATVPSTLPRAPQTPYGADNWFQRMLGGAKGMPGAEKLGEATLGAISDIKTVGEGSVESLQQSFEKIKQLPWSLQKQVDELLKKLVTSAKGSNPGENPLNTLYKK